MWFYARGAASTTNLLLSLTDYMQVFVARTKLLGDPEKPTIDGEIARQRRVGAMAWTQILGGVGGIGAFIAGLLGKKDDDEELSLTKKLGLSFTTLLSAATLLATYSEKMVIATTSKGKKIGNETSGIVLDASNDIRTFFEYLIMTVYPWARSIKPVKTAIDIAVPFLALRDGFEILVHDGVSKVFKKEINYKLPQKVKEILKRIFFFNGREKYKPENISIPKILSSNWFLGENGTRNKIIAPIFKFLGCKNFPELFTEDEGSDKVLFVRSPLVEEGNIASYGAKPEKPKTVKFPHREDLVTMASV